MEDRYFIDKRCGCIAVRDRQGTDPDYNGLHADTEGVIQYWDGYRWSSTCATCGHKRDSGWKLKPEDVEAAHKLCRELNEKDNQ